MTKSMNTNQFIKSADEVLAQKEMLATEPNATLPTSHGQSGVHPKFSQVQLTLFKIAGADVEVLNRSTPECHTRYEGIGILLLCTAILSFLTSFYAAFQVTKITNVNPLLSGSQPFDWSAFTISFFIAAVWAFIVLNIDRFLMVTNTGEKSSASAKISLAMRILMAGLLSFTISKPLETALFKSSLDRKIAEDQQSFVDQKKVSIDKTFETQISLLQKRRDELFTQKKSICDRRDTLYRDWQSTKQQADNESAGLGQTGVRGTGKVYEALRTSAMESELEYRSQKPRLDADEKEIDRQLMELDERIQGIERQKIPKLAEAQKQALALDGLMPRIMLIHAVSPVISTLIMALLFLIDMTPLLAKQTLPDGPYETLRNQKRRNTISEAGIEQEIELMQGGGIIVSTVDRTLEASKVRNGAKGTQSQSRGPRTSQALSGQQSTNQPRPTSPLHAVKPARESSGSTPTQEAVRTPPAVNKTEANHATTAGPSNKPTEAKNPVEKTPVVGDVSTRTESTLSAVQVSRNGSKYRGEDLERTYGNIALL